MVKPQNAQVAQCSLEDIRRAQMNASVFAMLEEN